MSQNLDPQSSLRRTKSTSESSSNSPAQPRVAPQVESKAAQAPVPQSHALVDNEDSVDPLSVAPNQHAPQSNGLASSQVPSIQEPKSSAPAVQKPPTTSATPKQPAVASPTSKQTPPEDPKHSRLSLKKDGRRTSWLSSISSKLSSSSDKSTRSNSVSSVSSNRKSPQPSPSVERSNPLDVNAAIRNANPDEKPIVLTPRRPSVLVAAGTETKVDNHPNFLSSALRRLSSGNTATLGKAATGGAICARKTMNIDHNRRRTKIDDFDQNKLRRVAFKVDVEIAGIAAQADEFDDHKAASPTPAPTTSNAGLSSSPKDSKMAKYKDRSEGAALKKTPSKEPKEDSNEAEEDAKQERVKREIKKVVNEDNISAPDRGGDNGELPDDPPRDSLQPPTTRKKEKKKRSEAERKERKEKKKRQAEANGLIPLEITVEDDDSDSSNSASIPGANTPRKGQPTTDPMRIYKRCCQLRETPALAVVKDQIAKPSATLAEAPGTVASIDLSGTELTLADVQTLGDWLAVVPVRRLILDDCNLSDEAVRIILSGLSGCKNQEQARANRKIPRKPSGKPIFEQMGVIEKLSLKNNPSISAIGWKHIALFVHLCQSLRGIDLSGIPFPANARGDLSRTSTTNANLQPPQDSSQRHISLSTLFARALAERFGDRLEELILGDCGLTSAATSEIVDSVIKCKVKRLGLANNNFNLESCEHVVRYVESGICEGLDMGGNDLNGGGHLLTQVLTATNPLFAMSLADCNLGYEDLSAILTQLSQLKNFKFIDLSRNHQLFSGSKDVVSLLRKRLPKMRDLKRIHLSDVDMTPNQLIALSEVFPECPVLAHVSVLDNQKIIDCLNSQQAEGQEEACAVLVSLMTAVRTSKTLAAVEIEVPGQESSEVIKALSSQVVAYSLRNLERSTLSEVGLQDEKAPERLDKHAPEILLHLVGHMDGYPDELTNNDEPAPDEDYMMATNGIVKALGVCLGSKDRSRVQSRNISPNPSGTTTPRSGQVTSASNKPKNVSLSLLDSARKIRLRLRPAMIREDQAGNNNAYRKSGLLSYRCAQLTLIVRLSLIDQTLERTIKRFEDEYPESRTKESPSMFSQTSSSLPDAPSSLSRLTSLESTGPQAPGEQDPDPIGLKLSRTDSNQSLARALTQEEGRMHRFGQTFRREVLKPTGTDDLLHGTSVNDDPESGAFAALRARLEGYTGEEMREEVEKRGVDHVVRELGIDLQQLRLLEREDPEAFAKLKDSQLAAQLNAGMLNQAEYEKRKQEGPVTFNGAVTVG